MHQFAFEAPREYRARVARYEAEVAASLTAADAKVAACRRAFREAVEMAEAARRVCLGSSGLDVEAETALEHQDGAAHALRLAYRERAALNRRRLS